MPDSTAAATPATPPPHPPAYFEQPECSIDTIRATGPMLVALAAAQAMAQTVGKDAENTEKHYRYATADSLVGEARRCLGAHGLSLITSWRLYDPPFDKVSTNQWADYRVVMDWRLLHGSPDGAVGEIAGTAEILAIGSAGRPPDKSLLAARTTLAGAIAMSLLQLDRAVDDEDVAGRAEPDATDRRAAPPQRAGRLSTEAKDALDAALRRLHAARRAAGHTVGGKPITLAATLADLSSEPVTTDAQAERVVEAAALAYEDLRA